ncbi:MmgE/PrpD family protein [Gordonia sp. TBRC 11910]|uniref:MmgE/PrpD family protein n=1 Tax=Gordonia asplenii TaxID=2725283 RepID=A0A848L626_9ACTN|nr:MmgE/PrpD family protein [Gordonia asplenii]NMO03068.1 MmgE/PrpD family protein [Gordonia asplenii]
MPTIVERLAEFASQTTLDALPDAVVSESKRILLDTLGCAVASLDDVAAQRGVAFGQQLGGERGPASILGTSRSTSVGGAAFANAELVNALDQDAVLPPGHVTPYVVPGTLATAEASNVSGERLLAAIAVAHEMSFRIGKATDYLRDIKDGVVTIPKVIGYSSTLFGGTAGIGVVKGFSVDTMADALGIMGSTMPTNTQRAWMMHAPSTTIKYQLAGGLALSTVTAAAMAELGHTGDRQMLDDREFGFPRFIGTTRWEPAPITADLGEEWTFTQFQAFKPYPHCRVMHGLFDALIEIVTENDIAPHEIDSIDAWGESFVMQPVWVNEDIRNPRDAQFSMTHGLALAAHRIAPGKDWQTDHAVHDRSVLDLMTRSTFHAHPDFAQALAADPSARTTRLELTARGTTFTGDRQYPKGVLSPDPETYLTDDELIAKFRHNVDGVLSAADADHVIDAVFDLEHVAGVADMIARVRPAKVGRPD